MYEFSFRQSRGRVLPCTASIDHLWFPPREVKEEDEIKPEGEICITSKWNGSWGGFVKNHLDGEKHSWSQQWSKPSQASHLISMLLCNGTWLSGSKMRRLICNIKGWDRQIWRRNTVKEQEIHRCHSKQKGGMIRLANWLNSPEQPCFYY